MATNRQKETYIPVAGDRVAWTGYANAGPIDHEGVVEPSSDRPIYWRGKVSPTQRVRVEREHARTGERLASVYMTPYTSRLRLIERPSS